MRPTPTTPTLDHLELPKGAEPPSRYRVQLDEKCLCFTVEGDGGSVGSLECRCRFRRDNRTRFS